MRHIHRFVVDPQEEQEDRLRVERSAKGTDRPDADVLGCEERRV
jgi:hypothetical protein